MVMNDRPRSLDEQIKKAIQAGVFDDLPGRGQPLSLDENPFEDPSWKLANHILQTGGFSLPWIETRKEIDRDYQSALEELRRTWNWKTTKTDQNLLDFNVDGEWIRAQEIFKSKVEDLNKRIFNFNLEAPLDQFKLRQKNFEWELKRIKNNSN